MQKTHVHNGHSKNPDFLPFDLEGARERLSDFNHRVTDFIRDKPAVALLGALGLGFMLSRLVNRR